MAGPGAPRPLRGKSFFLDLPSGRAARELAVAIKRLGGVTESFLSKEVSYVVSSNKEAKRDKARTQPEKRSNEASEDAKAMGPVPSFSKGNHPRPHQKPSDTVLISRGKELLQKAMKNQDTCSGSSILASARLWGVQILHVDDMLLYAQQLLHAVSEVRKQCQKTEVKYLATGLKTCKDFQAECHVINCKLNVTCEGGENWWKQPTFGLPLGFGRPTEYPRGKLKPPFLKVEDQSRQFRPFHHQFKSFPDLNFLAPKSSSPFEPLRSLSNSCRTRAVEGCPIGSKGEKSPQSTPVTVPKKKRGFCECCQETFEELQKHLQSPQHKHFALDDSQYGSLDRVIAQLSCSFVEHSAKVLRSCLTDEHLVPQAQVTGEIEMLTAELGKEREQPEQELFIDHSLKTKEGSCCLPRDRLSNPSEGGGLKTCSVGAGLARRVCAAHGTLEEFVLGDTDLGLAPDLGWVACIEDTHGRETTASLSEPHGQQVLGPASHLPQALPACRKHQLCRQSTQVGKKPRLELESGGGLSLCEQTNPVGGGMGGQGAGQTSEPGLPGVVETGSLPLSTKLSSRPCSSVGLDLCLCRDPGDPASHLEAVSRGFDTTEAAAASTVGECGWSRVNVSSKGEQLRGENEITHRNVISPDVESTRSQTSCPLPSPKLLGAKAGCCCSLCVRAAEKRALDLPGHGKEQGPCPGLLQPPLRNTQAEHDFSSSSESDWDVSLLSTLTGVQDGRIQPADRELLRRGHVRVRDSGYESQFCSVLKQKSELAWAGEEDKNCRNCCTETKGASFPIFETCFGSWTS